MELTRTERWILSNQCKILEILDSDQLDYYQTTQKILDYGYELLYSDQIPNILPDNQTMSPDESRLVLDILSMFSAITFSLEKIEDKTGIDIEQLKFRGFDGNDEAKYCSFAEFFCKDLDRFSELSTSLNNFNSHIPVIDIYERMLEVWEKCKDKYRLTKEELINIGVAAIYPDNL